MLETRDLPCKGHVVLHAKMKKKKDSYKFSEMKIAPGCAISDIS